MRSLLSFFQTVSGRFVLTPQDSLAHRQLYRAKAQGRNLVCLEPAAVPVVSGEEKRMLFDSSQFLDFE